MQEIDRVKSFMMKEFQWITVVCDRFQSYLGINVEVQDHAVVVDMIYYINQLLSEVDMPLISYKTPAVKECFHATKESPSLDGAGKKKFHTIITKFLHLAKRAWPDLLSATSFLCRRVKQPTKMDQQKLLRLLGYFQSPKSMKYNLIPSQPLGVTSHIDAAFAAHDDSKSHSGMVIFVVGMLVFASSKKQTCVTKSPTESELVALTDNIGMLSYLRNLLPFWSRTKYLPLSYIKTAHQL